MCLKAEFDELQHEYIRLKMQTEQEILSLNLQVQVLQKVRPMQCSHKGIEQQNDIQT